MALVIRRITAPPPVSVVVGECLITRNAIRIVVGRQVGLVLDVATALIATAAVLAHAAHQAVLAVLAISVAAITAVRVLAPVDAVVLALAARALAAHAVLRIVVVAPTYELAVAVE